MQPLFSSLNLLEIHHLKNLLESAGVRCRLRNEGLSTLAGEVPFTECAMQLVLENESDRGPANAILREMTGRRATAIGIWNCAGCDRCPTGTTVCNGEDAGHVAGEVDECGRDDTTCCFEEAIE